MIQRLSKFDPLPGVTVLVVRDHPEVLARAGITEAAESGLDQHVLQLKRRTEGNGVSQPVPQGGDTPGVHEAHLEPLLDQTGKISAITRRLSPYVSGWSTSPLPTNSTIFSNMRSGSEENGTGTARRQ